jgi:hypothetical protein
MKTRGVMDRVARGKETCGRGNGGVGDPRRTECSSARRDDVGSMTGDKRYEDEKRAHEVHSETTARKSQQGEATAGLMGLAMDGGSQPSGKKPAHLEHLEPLGKILGEFAGFEEAHKGRKWRLGGIRKSEGRGRSENCKMQIEKCKLERALGVGIGASARIGGGVGRRGGLARMLGEFETLASLHGTRDDTFGF